MAERQSFLSVASVSAGKALDPVASIRAASDKLSSITFNVPITSMDEPLGPGKRRFQAPESSKQHSAASLN